MKDLCRGRNLQLKDLLSRARVSRTAYYSLLRKDNVFPRSIVRLAECLGVSPMEFLDDENARIRDMQSLQAEVAGLCRRHPRCDPDNVRHALLLLREKPMDRLRRGLIRAQKFDFYR
jgi:transcriptional regulator with XRE-family HTH domain